MRVPGLPAALFFALALAAAVWRAPMPAAPAFAPPTTATTSALPPEFALERLPVVAPFAHSASLAELPDGRLAVAWYAGAHEAAGDVAIWFSTRDGTGWSAPRIVATRATTAVATRAYVGILGNPVLYAESERLHLWYVSVGFGGWSGSSINHSVSRDGGDSWSPAEKLVTSPFLNLSTLVRAPPQPLADGGLGLPVYHEFIADRAEWLRLSADGRILGKVRMPSQRPGLQPAVAALDDRRALALLRDGGIGDGRVMVDASEDGGVSWRASPSLPIANPNASVALLRLASGRLLLAANPLTGGARYELALFLSDDEGATWTLARVVENDPERKAAYAYPSLLQTRDGRIHLAYSWRYQAIAHAVFSEAWLKGDPL
jgi:predicted neuraminidase